MCVAAGVPWCGVPCDRRSPLPAQDGTIVCVGTNDYGQAAPPAGVAFDTVSAGAAHTCGVLRGGGLRCFGLGTDGQCAPPAAPPGGGFATVACGQAHTCALLAADGSPRCFGADDFGQAAPPPASTFEDITAGCVRCLLLEWTC